MSTERFIQSFLAARRASIPLMAVSTPDPAAAMTRMKGASAKTTPAFLWDAIKGLRALNEPALNAMAGVMQGGSPEQATLDPTGFLAEFAPRLPELSVLYCVHVGRYLADTTASGAAYVQALWNLRDDYKSDTRTLVMLGPSIVLPAELRDDVLTLDEPLPGDSELVDIVNRIVEDPEPDLRARAVDAIRGLAAFSAEQAVAMAVRDRKLDVDELWERKRRMIEATPGLTVWRGGETFADVGGNEQVKRFLTLLMKGRDPFKVVVFLDEIEKQLAGASGVGDNTGVSQAQHGKLLTYMQDRNVQGMRFIGPPGAGKSAIAKAIGAEAGVLTVALDLAGQKASLVGESEQRLDTALKVIDAVGGGAALFVATCNRDAALSPELRRRFATTFYFDLPDEDERQAIWSIFRAKMGLGTEAEDPVPEDRGWTGAEIRQACMLAYRLGIPLRDTPQFIVPVSVSAAEEIKALRSQADRRFLSASKPGVYVNADDEITRQVGIARRGRKLNSEV